jgi:hypothetical protein
MNAINDPIAVTIVALAAAALTVAVSAADSLPVSKSVALILLAFPWGRQLARKCCRCRT